MIVIGCLQAVVAVLIGVVLLLRGRRAWGLALVGIGASILVMALVAYFAFFPSPGRPFTPH